MFVVCLLAFTLIASLFHLVDLSPSDSHLVSVVVGVVVVDDDARSKEFKFSKLSRPVCLSPCATEEDSLKEQLKVLQAKVRCMVHQP